MNMSVHGLNAKIVSGDEANSFYHDAHNLEGCCDYVMANPPFNVDKVKSETAQNAGRLPFGLPGVNKNKEIGNANYLWISYFHAYLNETGRAGFVMASSATDSQGKDKIIREQLVNTGDVDVMLSVGNNFFYTKSLPCTLWFFDKNKREENKDKILFIDARNYYTVVDRTLNEWSHWQIKNLNAIVWLYRGEVEKYKKLLEAYITEVVSLKDEILVLFKDYKLYFPVEYKDFVNEFEEKFSKIKLEINEDTTENSLNSLINYVNEFNIQLNKNSSHANGTADGFKAKEKKELLSKIGKKYSNWNQYKKDMERDLATIDQSIKSLATVITEFKWIYEKFGDGEYKDILGLCKCSTKEEVSEKGYSLTPGAYVGVAPVEDDGVDFYERMTEIHKELLSLQAESNALMETISKNMKEMGL